MAINRTRKHSVHIMMSDEELATVKAKCEQTGAKSMQEYLIKTSLGVEIMDKREVQQLIELNRQFNELLKSDNRIGNNINQIARIANIYGVVNQKEIMQIQNELEDMRKERDLLWQQTRYFLAQGVQ